MDDKDRAIIGELQKNARASIKQIAAKVGLARSSVGARIAALQREDVIRGFCVDLGEDKPATSAILLVKLAKTPDVPCFESIADCSSVRSCVSVSGEIDLIVEVGAATIERLNQARDRVARLPGVASVVTHVVLARQK